MKNGPFLITDPVLLTLASHQKRSPNDPEAVWQLEFSQTHPIELRSTLGMQAQDLSLYPSFVINNRQIFDLQDYFAQPRIDCLLRDFAELTASPTPDLTVNFQFLIDKFGRLTCRSTLSNLSNERQELTLRLNACLSPMGPFGEFSSSRFGNLIALKAQTGNLSLGLSFNVNIKPLISPVPAMDWKAIIEANSSISSFFRFVFTSDPNSLARLIGQDYPENWDALISRKSNEELHQEMKIHCEDPDWQLLFSANTKLALQLINDAQADFPLYKTRNSISSSLANFNRENTVAGTSPANFSLLYLISLALLPTQPALVQKLYIQSLNQWKNQTNSSKNKLPLPILSSLAWRIFKHNQDQSFLKQVYPTLRDITLAWFDRNNDRDGDGLPEWSSTEQTALYRTPAFDILAKDAQAVPPWQAESLGLGILLERELESLGLIAHLLGENACEVFTHALREKMSEQMDAWLIKNPVTGLRDRDTHQSPPGYELFKGEIPEDGVLNLSLPESSHICMQLQADALPKRPEAIILKGINRDFEAVEERIPAEDIFWLPGRFFASSKQIFSRLNAIAILSEKTAQLRLYAPSFTTRNIIDLLAVIPQNTEESLQQFIADFTAAELPKSFYGLPENFPEDGDYTEEIVSFAWASLLAEVLIQNGYPKLAFEIISKLITLAKTALKTSHRFFERYRVLNGRGTGSINATAGLLPTELLLDLAGLRIFHADKAAIIGANILPWPIKIQFQGLELTRDGKNTQINFADGSSFHHYGSASKTFIPERQSTQTKPSKNTN